MQSAGVRPRLVLGRGRLGALGGLVERRGRRRVTVSMTVFSVVAAGDEAEGEAIKTIAQGRESLHNGSRLAESDARSSP